MLLVGYHRSDTELNNGVIMYYQYFLLVEVAGRGLRLLPDTAKFGKSV